MRTLGLVFSAAVIVHGPSLGAPDQSVLCDAYGAVGEVVATHVLDVTLREFIALNQGENPELLDTITTALSRAWTGEQMLEVGQLPIDDQVVFGEAAGSAAVRLMVEGASNSADGVARIMTQHCQGLGVSELMAQYRSVIEVQRQVLDGAEGAP